ncbi:MAG: epimerase [Planctomycetes bacterium]|nr:epimerase [Planctomycetota bacterium]
MDVLIIGGTQFVGRALTDAALAAGHEVTLFHRGQTGADIFPDVPRVLGDRDGEIERLDGRWDVVIDTCGYVPRLVSSSVDHLSRRAERYVFVSTISVYADDVVPPVVEASKLAAAEGDLGEVIDGRTYGPLKAQCERVVRDRCPDALIIRPGLIVGPWDPTDRFSYWPDRVRRGGRVLAPGAPERPIQIIDVRDLAEWTIAAIGAQCRGTYNLVGPESPLSMRVFLDACREVSGAEAEFAWIDDDALVAGDAKPMTEVPFWLPGSHPRSAWVFRIDAARARGAGLRYRTIEETIGATLAWLDTRAPDRVWKAGLSAEREAVLLQRD